MKLHPSLPLAVVAVAALLSGCTGTANPAASAIELAATASPTPEPTALATASPTTAPTLIPYPGPSIPPGTLTIDIGADPHLKFDKTQLTAPPARPS